MYRVSRLNTGLTVATAEMPHMSSVSVGAWFGAGSRYEPARLNGIHHFIEHLLFKGTKKRTARAISEAVEGIGGYLNAFTSEESTCFHAKASHTHFDDLLDVLMDMILHSRFDPVDIEKEREVIKEEIAMYFDEPQHYVQELLNEALWPDQPLGRPITGTPESLDSISRDEIIACLKNNYILGRCVITAAGKIRHGEVLQSVLPFARHLRKRHSADFEPAQNPQQRPVVRLFTKKTEQTQIALGVRTCSRHDLRRFALRLLNAMLGENMSSRLFQLIREERGLVYSIYSTPSFFEDTGDLVISAGLDVDKLRPVLKLILRELRTIADTAPRLGELRRARDYVIGQIELGSENTETQMNWMGEQLLGYGKIYRPAELKRKLHEVTPAQVQAVAREWFRPDRFTLAIVSPLKSTRGLAALLQGGHGPT